MSKNVKTTEQPKELVKTTTGADSAVTDADSGNESKDEKFRNGKQ